MSRFPSRSLFVALAVLAAACAESAGPAGSDPDLAVRPGLPEQAAPANDWIVVFREDRVPRPAAPEAARTLTAQQGGVLRFAYSSALSGFAASLSDAGVAAIRANPDVAYVETDAVGGIVTTQLNPPSWGLDRVDQRFLPLSASFTYTSTGSGVNVYILDTGVRIGHNDFGGRAQYVSGGTNGDFVGDGRGSAEDCHGHGTHVAGTAAGTGYGVAKSASIYAARVVNCSGSGTVSMVLAAVDWVTGNALRPAVVNMSLGYGDVQSLRDAVENSIAAGVNYSVAAGNGNFAGVPQNACRQSPAGAPSALTVGATDRNDKEASFSNYGTCVDLLAPGVSIKSDWYTSNTATNTISGTSMATPHVTGVVALYLQTNPGATPADVASAIKSAATPNVITLHKSSLRNATPNRLLFTSY